MRVASLGGLLLLVGLFVTGCGSTLCMTSKKHLQRFNGGTQPVYVTNPQIGREYEILKASGIYRLADRPEGARSLTLRPIHQYGRCGNPLMLSAITLGIIPGILPGARTFEYDLETNGVAEPFTHALPLYERLSIWEWLVPGHEPQVLAEALAWSSLRKQPNRPRRPGPRRGLATDGTDSTDGTGRTRQRDPSPLSRIPDRRLHDAGEHQFGWRVEGTNCGSVNQSPA